MPDDQATDRRGEPAKDTREGAGRNQGRKSDTVFLRKIAKLFKKKIVFFKDTHFSGDTIYINVDKDKTSLIITGHELLYVLS